MSDRKKATNKKHDNTVVDKDLVENVLPMELADSSKGEIKPVETAQPDKSNSKAEPENKSKSAKSKYKKKKKKKKQLRSYVNKVCKTLKNLKFQLNLKKKKLIQEMFVNF
ncbi:hypothetical protein [Mycoplasmopsis columbinasalis]|uniref:Uncharacterized protein n=1 Tax=Mycoplasmopsis columbinasalis TaxID=114880 RepID=A0A449BAC1_9BACT|nr:hypothetical protein [Mycoplasmopsis columbinasalis]VEU78128.1 Uncharacterised protein [Mycoplasmopsis columbinasalis]